MEDFKVMLITNIISPYRTPLFNIIFKKRNFNFKVVILAEKERNREWEIHKNKIKFDYQVLSGWHLFFFREKREIAIHINKGVFKMLFEQRPDVIITSGYDSLAYWQAFLYCKIFKKKYILWNETTLLSVGSIRGLRGLLKKIIIKGTDKYIVSGVKAKEYLKHLGAKCGDILTSIDTVDMEYFRKEVLEYQHNKDFFYKKEKYPKIIILFVGQLIKRKGISQVLKALNILGDPDIGFIIVGNGPEERNLKAFCAEKKLQNIFFEGFQQQEKLFEYYALADVFILPSFEEVWGLVVNEALASGLYVLSSKYAGASYDLIKEGWNGEVFNPDNVEEIVKLIIQAKGKIKDIRKRREAISQHTCRDFSIERSAEAFSRIIEEIYNTSY
jgi:glycosyltransferase involved in cell wall biosynthesis